jgi:type IV pilus assembly protein PilY1
MRHRESITVAYGETRDARRVVFTPSDDGTLRAMDATEGRLLWTYQSKEAAASTQNGSRMTDVRVLRFDARNDGVIDISDGDRVWLYFGVHSAGAAYYALDVTDPTAARLLWHIDSNELPDAGQSWATPTIARVKVGGEIQNGEHFVLVLGGGYDTRTDTSGNRLYIVDAADGRLLWFGGGASAAAPVAGAGGAGAAKTVDLALSAMRYPIAARVAAIDTDGDAFADRLYAADLGGQVWRFDVRNGNSRATLVTGGVLASLGKADASPAGGAPLPSGSDARRFFNAPDVALIRRPGGAPYFNIALGSGDAAAVDDPSAVVTAAPVHDRFYSLRDRNPFIAISQATYDATAPIVDADLVDITDLPFNARVPTDAAGWKLDLRSDSGAEEQVLAESLTVNGVVLFTTFQAGGSRCAGEGSGRVYALKVETAQPALDLNDDGQLTIEDRSVALSMPGVPESPQIELDPPPGDGSGPIVTPPMPPGSTDPPPRGSTRCRVGAQTLAHCVPFRALIRTFWRRHSTL